VAESRRRYLWVATWEDPLSATAALPVAAQAVERLASRYPWVQSAEVNAEDGKLTVDVIVRSNDQWRVHQRQLKTIAVVAAALRITRSRFGEPDIFRLPPHRNRGYLRGSGKMNDPDRNVKHRIASRSLHQSPLT
jgi:hypothetical protein